MVGANRIPKLNLRVYRHHCGEVERIFTEETPPSLYLFVNKLAERKVTVVHSTINISNVKIWICECLILELCGCFSPSHFCWVNFNLSTVVQQLITKSNQAHTATQITVLIMISFLILLTWFFSQFRQKKICYLEDFNFSNTWLFCSQRCNTSIFEF